MRNRLNDFEFAYYLHAFPIWNMAQRRDEFCLQQEILVSEGGQLCDDQSSPQDGDWNGNCSSPAAASCARLFEFTGSQGGQNFQRDIGLSTIGSQSHYSGPVARWDASRLPATHSRVPLPERFSDRASAPEGHNYRFPVIHTAQHSSHHAN